MCPASVPIAGDHVGHRGRVGEVERHQHRPDADLAERRSQRREGVGRPGHQRDVVAVATETTGDGQPETGAGAEDKKNGVRHRSSA